MITKSWKALLCVAVIHGSVHASGNIRDDEIERAVPTALGAYQFLHENPEKGKEEKRAQKFLTQELQKLGFAEFISSPSAPTAVIAVFDSHRLGHTVALRAEMDARPIAGEEEPPDHSPRSKTPGMMHNCGHDIHSAILLGAAKVVTENPTRFHGKIVFLFQPAEETPGGADDIVRDGLLKTIGVERMFALHSAPGMPVGTIVLSPGTILAGSNYFTLGLSGRGSHAAAPQDGDDVILSAMRVAQELSYSPARRLDIAERPVVISITRFEGNSKALNVLPTSVTMDGTIRAFEDLRAEGTNGETLESKLVGLVTRLSSVYGLNPDWQLRQGPPPTRNDPALFDAMMPSLVSKFSGVIDTKFSRGMFAEDFAYYTPTVPSLYASLGIAKGNLGNKGVHTRQFTAHPDSLAVGIELMTLFAEIGTVSETAGVQ